MSDLRYHLWSLVAASLLITTTIGFFGPITVYANNIGELSASLPTLLVENVTLASVACILLIVVGLPFIFIQPERVLAIFGALAVLFYLQGYIFVHPYGSFDGRPIIWRVNAHWGYVEALLWGGGLLFATIFPMKVKPYLVHIFIFLFVVQVSYAGVLSASTKDLWSARDRAPVSDSLFKFSNERNLILILLDQFQSTVLTRLFEDHPELMEIFAGFRYYPNTLGVTPSTYLSVPALLSGKIYENRQPVQEYMSEVLGAQSLPRVLDSSGYRVDMLTLPRYCDFLGGISCRPVESLFLTRSEEVEYEAIKLLDFTIFRFVPHALKKRVHSNYEWWLQPKFYPERIGADGLWRSIEFPRLLREKGTRDAPGPTAKFFHLLVPHPPYSRDANCEHYTTLQDGSTTRWGNTSIEGTLMQSRCALKIVAQIFTVLDQIGAFHNSDIVIFSDHGTGVPARRAGQTSLFSRMETAFPVLMVKAAGDTEGLQVDRSALSLADIPRIVGGLLDLDTEFAGSDPQHDRILVNRPRQFLNYIWHPLLEKEPYIPNLQHWRVSGDALDNASWTRLPDLVPPLTPAP